ncbi:MAG TPA: sensor histidine kinase [Acidimicrobiia bacterium]|nr:sensor histidine kinase [Acidimicrobiia bacterium]
MVHADRGRVVRTDRGVVAAARRLRHVSPQTLDVLLGTLFVVVGLGAHLAGGDGTSKFRAADALSVALTLTVAVPYYWRRRAPLLVLAISVVPVVVLTVRDYDVGATPTMLLVGLYTVAAYCDTRAQVLAATEVALGLVAIAVFGSHILRGSEIVLEGVLLGAAFGFGAAVRNRRLYTDELEARAALAARDRAEQAERAVAEERLHIAQELHDVVAHSLGVIAVQAGVGAHVIEQDPVEAKRSLESISNTSRSTLSEIRRMLSVLRSEEGADYLPVPGLAHLDGLVREVAGAGLHVDVCYDGARVALPLGVDFSAYRIVQEALTNVLKHAGRARAVVRVGYEPGALMVEVVDDGRGVNGNAAPGGHGLLGMRERVGVYGGSFEAGPRAGGGFRVAARLPYGEPA